MALLAIAITIIVFCAIFGANGNGNVFKITPNLITNTFLS